VHVNGGSKPYGVCTQGGCTDLILSYVKLAQPLQTTHHTQAVEHCSIGNGCWGLSQTCHMSPLSTDLTDGIIGSSQRSPLTHSPLCHMRLLHCRLCDVQVVSDGTSGTPWCASLSERPPKSCSALDRNEQQSCATGLCRAAGYAAGAYIKAESPLGNQPDFCSEPAVVGPGGKGNGWLMQATCACFTHHVNIMVAKTAS
jgi:hypothetical protein